ncbi:hypothetical protein JYU34_005166 [Plutella xylostella]|uniref:Uncharacterized protein n=1 Tax=Plutella xylostella TaxID=51655 RepID=A0ABQ7QW33_PLUXY|nr:uncharacterized protein LOC105390451 [Plutella xylostella]KAG7309238.1 hypothetical protein JYU34_005166 [Plutella xylostella]
MPKKLKVVVKSLFGHEIRKDVSLDSLKSLKLEDAWPFIREEIEIEIGSSQLVCIPHITEADLYKVTSLFVPNEKETNGKMFTPLGELRNNINTEKSNPEYVKLLTEGDLQEPDFKFPHDSVKITLQDEAIKNKVRVIMVNFSKSSIPKGKDLVNNVYLDVKNNKALQGKKSVYMITNVLYAKTIEFRVTRGTSSRIFHLGNGSPLVFGLEEFLIGEDGKLTAKNPVTIKSKSLHWQKVDPLDQLYQPERATANA